MKTRKTLLGICLLLASPLAAQEKNYVSEAWVADKATVDIRIRYSMQTIPTRTPVV